MGTSPLELHVETNREDDGRWIADAVELPGVMAYGKTEDEALAKAKVLALQVVTDRLERGEDPLTGHEQAKAFSSAGFSGLGFTAGLLASLLAFWQPSAASAGPRSAASRRVVHTSCLNAQGGRISPSRFTTRSGPRCWRESEE
jgi:predicted RNase H-like HicB family nuclease